MQLQLKSVAGVIALVMSSTALAQAQPAQQTTSTTTQQTPITAYYDNRYVDELEKAGFFKRLWQ